MSEIIGALAPLYLDAESGAMTVAESLLVPDRLEAVRNTFKDEIEESSPKDRAKASMVLGAFALEQGPINEAISAVITTNILASTGNPITAGVIGGLSYAVQQGVYGLATAKGVTAIPKTEQAYHEQFGSSEEDRKKAVTLIEKAWLLVSLGMSALVINEHVQVEGQSVKKDARLIGRWMPALIATDIVVFTSIIDAVDRSQAAGVDSAGGELLDYLTDPATFVAAFGLYKFVGFYRKYQKNLEKPSIRHKLKKIFSKNGQPRLVEDESLQIDSVEPIQQDSI